MKTLILMMLILSSCDHGVEITDNVNNNNCMNNTNYTYIPSEVMCDGGTFLPYETLTDRTDCYGNDSDTHVLCRQYCCDGELTIVGMAKIREVAKPVENFYLEDVTNCGGCGVSCGGDAPYCRCTLTKGVINRLPCMCTGIPPED